jgi:PAS domain S-box-containing protein
MAGEGDGGDDRRGDRPDLSNLLSNVPGVAYRCRNEPGWPMEFVSDGCADLVGHEAAAFERGDRSWEADVIHPDDRERVREAVQSAVAAGEAFTVTYRARTTDGTVRHLWEQGRGVEGDGDADGDGDGVDGSVTHLEGYVTDVTERVEREADLARQSSLLDSIFEEIPVHLYVKDAEGRHLRVSEAFVDDPESLVGMTDAELDLVSDEHGERATADDRQVIARGEAILDKEEYLPDSDQWNLTSKVPWRDAEGNVVGLIGVTRDVTERKRQREEIERQNRRLERFATTVSHDLRNPLAVATGHLDLARATCDHDSLDAAADALDRMDELVEEVLALARGGETVVDAARVDLTAAAERAWAAVDADGALLRTCGTPTVVGDEPRVRRLLENLFRNSVEHGSTGNRSAERSGDIADRRSASSQNAERSDDSVEHGPTGSRPPADDSVERGPAGSRPGAGDRPGGGSTDGEGAIADPDPDRAAGADCGRLTVRVGELDDGRGFYVADDGAGVPAGERDRLFEPGVSGGDGTGYGLAIVREIARAHGWSVALVESDAGGARFEFATRGGSGGAADER